MGKDRVGGNGPYQRWQSLSAGMDPSIGTDPSMGTDPLGWESERTLSVGTYPLIGDSQSRRGRPPRWKRTLSVRSRDVPSRWGRTLSALTALSARRRRHGEVEALSAGICPQRGSILTSHQGCRSCREGLSPLRGFVSNERVSPHQEGPFQPIGSDPFSGRSLRPSWS